ncbi:LLM class flavin-dependent oxidoreductase [Lampropedia puyangensis]|uniref:LLM class flavin-dependent oxidoreductase n=2 Tax=Lampropedia puyangensis TaxID=1330072 RepID=A0A4S8EVC4_9BURK|nr:LLM class flavin-dependent oxidoreductase [Lampropedia puyangensis]
MFWATGTHSAGWRHPDARTDGAFDIAFIQSVVKTAEAAKFDFLFLGDRLVSDPALAKTNPGQMSRLEPFTVASAVAAVTTHIGLVVTANPTYNDPYTVARMTAALDHLSGGRASWNLVTGADPAAAQNFGRKEHWSTEQRYDWADEFVDVVRKLWDSWEDDAVQTDLHGLKIDRNRIHPIAHTGPLIHIDSALDMPRPPQGHVVLLHAGTSDRSRELAAREADVVFTGAATHADAQAYYRDIKARAAKYDRAADDISIMPGLIVITAETTAEAVAIYDQLNALITLDAEDPRTEGEVNTEDKLQGFQYVSLGRGSKRNLTLVSSAIGVDVRGNDHDALVPPDVLTRAHEAGQAIFKFVSTQTRRTVDAADPAQRIRFRDLIHASIAQTATVVGNPQEVADFMQHWLHTEAADGFNIFPSYLPGTVDDFARLVVPELQARGLFRLDYSGHTFRDHLRLTRPPRRTTPPLSPSISEDTFSSSAVSAVKPLAVEPSHG